jgi:hypothetical protein
MNEADDRWVTIFVVGSFIIFGVSLVAAFTVAGYVVQEQKHRHNLELIDRGAAEVRVIPREAGP